MFDTVGVLILIALIALFGFLTSCAWNLKNAILKWGGAVIGVIVAEYLSGM